MAASILYSASFVSDASTENTIIYGTENGVKQTTGDWISDLYMTTGRKFSVGVKQLENELNMQGNIPN
jgi:hypothetical protein